MLISQSALNITMDILLFSFAQHLSIPCASGCAHMAFP